VDDRLAPYAELPEQRFAPGDVLFEEGGRSGRVFVLVEGTVEVYRGDVLVTSLSEPGAFLGEMAALLGTAHSARVVASQPTRAFVVDDAAGAIAERPALALAIARLLARRLHAMTTYLVDIKNQYADQPGHLGMMHEVLSGLMNVRPNRVEPGSARHDVPDC